jgi:hypothetical protein
LTPDVQSAEMNCPNELAAAEQDRPHESVTASAHFETQTAPPVDAEHRRNVQRITELVAELVTLKYAAPPDKDGLLRSANTQPSNVQQPALRI